MSQAARPGEGQLLVRSDAEGRTVLAVTGEIDLSNVDDLSKQIDAAIKPTDSLIFDLSDVSFMDSSGIALLLNTVNSVADAVVRAPSKQVRRVLEATGLTSVLRMAP